MRTIATDFASFVSQLSAIPWFLNLGKPHPRDSDVDRIWVWSEWHGPEQGFCDWFGRYPALVRNFLGDEYSARHSEMTSAWNLVERSVRDLSIPNVPEYDPDEDAWYGPTACVWGASFTAALVGWHVLLKRALPDPIVEEWAWLLDGHWPCDYAEEPIGYWDESMIDVPASKLLVY